MLCSSLERIVAKSAPALALAVLWPPFTAQGQTDLRRAWNQAVLQWNSALIQECSLEARTGFETGAAAFSFQMSDCASYFVRADRVAQALEDVHAYSPLPAFGHREACYRAGWLMGFLRAHNDLWGSCSQALGEATRQGVAARVEECRQVGQAVAADSVTLPSWIEQQAQSESDRESALALRTVMAAFVVVGESERAWQLALETARTTSFARLPCAAAIALTGLGSNGGTQP